MEFLKRHRLLVPLLVVIATQFGVSFYYYGVADVVPLAVLSTFQLALYWVARWYVRKRIEGMDKYRCHRCKYPRLAGATMCPECGRQFAPAVVAENPERHQ